MDGYYPNYPRYCPNLVITRVTLLVGFETSSIVGMKLSAFFAQEYINADDITAYCLYPL